MIMKINKAKIRRDIAVDIAQKYIASGKEWTCTACIFCYRQYALTKANELLVRGSICPRVIIRSLGLG
jgi:PHP family Zn ribbon phosphoesterase